MSETLADWQRIGGVDLADVAQARLQAHWASQVLAASADALLDKQPDDSHTNLFWRGERGALEGRVIAPGVTLGLRLSDLTLVMRAAPGSDGAVIDELALAGKTLADALGWVSELARTNTDKADAALALRDYDMPAHPVQTGAAFATPNADALTELGRWYGNATAVLQALASSDARSTPVAIWPHHFDLGGILFADRDADAETARQIGFGLSPGDSSYDEPYFYVTPWPIPDGAALPALPAGHWYRENFTGAILTASEIARVEAAGDQRAVVERYLSAAIATGDQLISSTQEPTR